MKAIRIHEYGGPEQLRYEDAPISEAGSGQVLVRVHAASVNPIDYKLASGAMRAVWPITLPWIPGADFSGVVEAVGLGVTSVKRGDAVYGESHSGGAYAQFIAPPAGFRRGLDRQRRSTPPSPAGSAGRSGARSRARSRSAPRCSPPAAPRMPAESRRT